MELNASSYKNFVKLCANTLCHFVLQKKYLILIVFIFSSLQAQVKPTLEKQETPKDFIIKVSQFGQFVKRFNYEEDFWGNKVTPSFSEKINRAAYINLLFNKYDQRLDSTSTSYSVKYKILKEEFIRNTVEHDYKINRISDSIYSIANCSVTYKNKPENINLVLKQEQINNGIGWTLYDAYAKFLYLSDKDNNFRKFIPPTSNELNYIHLINIFNSRDSLAEYAYNSYKCNPLSVFFQLLKSGDIQYKNVMELEYVIFDIPGWVIHIKEYNRKGDNSGWLIDNIERYNGDMKPYLKNVVSSLK